MRDRIDPLIQERAPWLFQDMLLMPLLRQAFEIGLSYEATLQVARQIRILGTQDVMAHVTARIVHDLDASGYHNLPQSGAALVVANHPTGIADGIVLHSVLAEKRPDLFFYANSDILRVLPQMSSLIVPVEWRRELRTHHKTKETFARTAEALQDGKLGVIFPSGRIAKRRGLRLYEREWMSSAAMIARKFDVPVVPVNIAARNSALFYLLDIIHPTLRDITLFHETLNKHRQPFRVRIGKPVEPRELPQNASVAIGHLRDAVLSLAGGEGRSVSMVRSTPFLKRLRLV